MYRKLAIFLLAVSSLVFAVTPADKAVLQAQAQATLLNLQQQSAIAIQGAQALKALIDLLPLDPPPVAAWPRSTPDVLDINFINFQSVMDAMWLDGNPGWVGGGGRAIHYGSMSGPSPATPPPGQQADWSGKFSNASCLPSFKVDPANGIKYLHVCTDGTAEQATAIPGICGSCRMIWWDFKDLTPRSEYYARWMERATAGTFAGQTDLGIKDSGFGGAQPNYTEVLELGQKNPLGWWPLQLYRYDAEATQGVDIFPNVQVYEGKWVTYEEHVRANTFTNGVYNKDGLIEVKVDGKLVWSRNNVLIFNSQPITISRFLLQKYHGGTKPPGKLGFDIARFSICKTTWCGPAPEIN